MSLVSRASVSREPCKCLSRAVQVSLTSRIGTLPEGEEIEVRASSPAGLSVTFLSYICYPIFNVSQDARNGVPLLLRQNINSENKYETDCKSVLIFIYVYGRQQRELG